MPLRLYDKCQTTIEIFHEDKLMIDKRIKIVHILEGFEGGMSTFICNVLPRLVKEDFDVTLIGSLTRSNSDANISISKLKANGVIVHIIPMYREI